MQYSPKETATKMNFEEARKKVTAFVCSDCMRHDCPNPEKRMDFSAERPCRYKKKKPKKRVKPESQGVSGVV